VPSPRHPPPALPAEHRQRAADPRAQPGLDRRRCPGAAEQTRRSREGSDRAAGAPTSSGRPRGARHRAA